MTAETFVWLYVADRAALRELPRTGFAKLARRLYAEHAWRLITHIDTRVLVTERTADALCRYAWGETGTNVFRMVELGSAEGVAPDTYADWGLPPRVGQKLDALATDDAFLVAYRNIAACDSDTWGRFSDPGEELLRAYYRARVNHQLIGIMAGRATVQHGRTPEA